MEQLYYDASNPASYGGVQRLVQAVRKQGGNFTRRQVVDWLRAQDTYTLHKPARKRFPRNSYIVYGPNELWQADLNDMRGISEHNNGVNYLLTVIDVFSKMLWVKPLREKPASKWLKHSSRYFATALMYRNVYNPTKALNSLAAQSANCSNNIRSSM